MIINRGDERTTGLMNPTGPFPIAMRASLINVIMDATTGAEADVPKTKLSDPSMPISEFKICITFERKKTWIYL